MSRTSAKTAAAAPRGRLTPDRIFRAALEYVDAHGIDALTMRELAKELGFEAMALYRHVATKDEILGGMLDLVLAETEPAAESPDWAGAIRMSAISLHRALARHPWAARLLISPIGLRPARIQFAESLLARLRDGNFSDEACFHAYHVLDAHVIGYSLWLMGHVVGDDEREAAAQRVHEQFDAYPLMASHVEQHSTEGPHRGVDAFEVGLDLILTGLATLRATDSR